MKKLIIIIIIFPLFAKTQQKVTVTAIHGDTFCNVRVDTIPKVFKLADTTHNWDVYYAGRLYQHNITPYPNNPRSQFTYVPIGYANPEVKIYDGFELIKTNADCSTIYLQPLGANKKPFPKPLVNVDPFSAPKNGY